MADKNRKETSNPAKPVLPDQDAQADAVSGKKYKNKYQFEGNNKYFTISVYTVVVVLICAFIVRSIFLWSSTSAAIGNGIAIISPFIWGAFVAFVLNPVVSSIDKHVFSKFISQKYTKLRLFCSLLSTYILIIGLIVLLIAVVIPRMVDSVSTLVVQIQSWYEQLLVWLGTMETQHPEYDYETLNETVQSFGDKMLKFISTSGTFTEVLPAIYTTSMSVIHAFADIFIILIASVYLIIDKNRVTKHSRRIMYAVLPQELCDRSISVLGECANIFSQYITGKTIDSIIIGIICFILMTIFNMPYGILIALIIGVTNMIPYFGPLIGAIPGFFVVLITSPIKALVYLILVLALQQFDGWFLGPKILGNSTGLRPFWVVFGVTVGGSVGGVVGMFLGVPVVGVIALLVEKFTRYRLHKKGLDGMVNVRDDEEKPEGLMHKIAHKIHDK